MSFCVTLATGQEHRWPAFQAKGGVVSLSVFYHCNDVCFDMKRPWRSSCVVGLIPAEWSIGLFNALGIEIKQWGMS